MSNRIRYLRVWQFTPVGGLGIDIIGRVHFDNRDRFSLSMGSIGKATEPCQQTTEWLLTSDFWLFLEPWHARWYEYEIFIASCTDSIYDLENERWLFGDMIDHVGIYGSRVAEGLSTFYVGLVLLSALFLVKILYIFLSFTADIVSRAYPMPSHPLSSSVLLNRAKVGQNWGFHLFWKKKFHLIHMKLVFEAHWIYI